MVNRNSRALLIAALVISTTATGAPQEYTRKRAIYDEMAKTRNQDAIVLISTVDKRAAHSKRWASLTAAASKEFGADHACAKTANQSLAAWRQMNSGDAAGAATFAYQAGNWAATCYDEIEKLDPPSPTAKR